MNLELHDGAIPVSLELVKQTYPKLINIQLDHYLLIDDTDDIKVKFGLWSFNSSDGDGENIVVDRVFVGEGFAGSLRECRHIWWGHEGYTFYLPANPVIKALEHLKEYFDFD